MLEMLGKPGPGPARPRIPSGEDQERGTLHQAAEQEGVKGLESGEVNPVRTHHGKEGTGGRTRRAKSTPGRKERAARLTPAPLALRSQALTPSPHPLPPVSLRRRLPAPGR